MMRNTQSRGTGEVTRLLTGWNGPARMSVRPTTFKEHRNGEPQDTPARRHIELNSALTRRNRGLHIS
jgi:hypothetical protein